MKLGLAKLLLISSCVPAVGVTTVTTLSVTGNVSILNEELRFRCLFLDQDETLLYACDVKPNAMAIYQGIPPYKADDEDFYYTFTGWDKNLGPIREDTTFHAVYEQKRKEFTVTFVNDDGTLLYTNVLQSGETPVYLGSRPTKEPTADKEYYFKGWDKEIVPIHEDTVYTAVYNEADREYLVSFYNHDDSLLYSTKVVYNGTAIYRGAMPTPPESTDPAYVYVFSGWDRPLSGITEDTDIHATFDYQQVKVTVTFLSEEGITLYIDEVFYGESADYQGPLPTKEAEEDGTVYTFAGWDKPIDNVTEDIEVYPVFTESIPEFTVTFKNYDGTVLGTSTVTSGGTAEYEGETPTRETADGIIYTFTGWDRDLTDVTRDFFTLAIYEEDFVYVPVHFLNYDESLLETVEVEYGTSAEDSYSGETPTRPSDENYRYEFAGWNEDLSCITEETDAYAVFTPIPLEPPIGEGGEGSGGEGAGDEGAGGGSGEGGGGGGGGGGKGNLCVVSFCEYDGTVLDTDLVLIGKDAYFDGKYYPHRQSTPEYDYYWYGNDWDSSSQRYLRDIPSSIAYDKSREAVQRSIQTFAQYYVDDGLFRESIVTFRNDDGTLLYEDIVAPNEMPEYGFDEAPVSAGDPTAIFLGWDRQLVLTQDSYTVYATYGPSAKPSGGGGETGGDISGNPVDMPEELEQNAVFSFATPYEGPVYFRENAFLDATDTAWTALEGSFQTNDASFAPMRLTGDKLGTLQEDVDLSIRYAEYHRHQLMPVYSDDAVEPVSDGALTNNVELELDWSFLPTEINPVTIQNMKDAAYTTATWNATEVAYRTYVSSRYLGVPENIASFLQEFIAEHSLSATNPSEILDVVEFLKGYAKYNLKFAAYPEEGSRVRYFLETAKEGICNHFASALVLLLRSMGVPARFVTGYLGVSTGVDPTSDAEYDRVTARQAHAWAEVYIDGVGWVDLDATPEAEEPGQGGEGGQGGQGGQGEGGEGGQGEGGQGGQGGQGGEGGQGEGGQGGQGEGGEGGQGEGGQGGQGGEGGQGGGGSGGGQGGGGSGGGGDVPAPNPYNPFGVPSGDPAEITITIYPATNTKTFDGVDMEILGEIDGSLDEGDTLIYNFCEQARDVGSYIARCRPRIYHGGKDVTSNYVGRVKMIFKSYSILVRHISVETASAEKAYDGEEFFAEEYTITSGSLVEGHTLSMTLPHVSKRGVYTNMPNAYAILDENQGTVTHNYVIHWSYGVLTIT